MKLAIKSPRGTADIYGEDIKYRDFINNIARSTFKVFNFEELITPAFEYTEVFSRSIGEETDIVQKEMYTFDDRKGRSLTLRPEGTAAVVRSAVEKKMFGSGNLPLKLFYIGNMFRYERPQKGRMREFWQLGVEALGSDNPVLDAEMIWMLNMIFQRYGFKNLTLLINSIGCLKCRKAFIKEFKKYLEPEAARLCGDCTRRLVGNPLRIFDCKVEGCRETAGNGPKISEYLCNSCKIHFDGVTDALSRLSVNFRISGSLVRGFDYYTKTVFEIISNDLDSAQNALGGGGRYDDLIAQFGGPDMP
ncbi:MAG: histidine--tRNA ligase, partial [Actinobacteria bacterium]|nr:histidine--tRNA ligase [Actinomycetota bacterium]